MHPVLTIAKRAALSASRILFRHFENLERLTVTTKQRSDFVSEADLQAERDIIQILRKTYPNHGILAEETGQQAGQDDLHGDGLICDVGGEIALILDDGIDPEYPVSQLRCLSLGKDP